MSGSSVQVRTTMPRLLFGRAADHYTSGAGVTTLQGRSDRVESLYVVLETIDDHHDEYSEWGPWDGIHVVGLELDKVSIDRIREELALALVQLDVEPSGFVIRRTYVAEFYSKQSR